MVLTPQKAKSMTVAKLKDELAERGLPVDGLKAVLCERLISNIDTGEEEAAQPTEAAVPVVGAEADEPEATAATEESEMAEAEPEAAEEEPEAAEEEPEAAEEEPEAAEEEVQVADADADTAEAPPAEAEEAPAADADAADADADAAAAGPESPASVGDDGDEPPTKKAKTANGAAAKGAAPRPKVSGDPSGKEIFIDNLPWSATEEAVKKLAKEQGGDVVSMRMMMTKEEKPQCAGLVLVRFHNREDAARALERIPQTKMEENTLEARPSSNSNTLFIGNLNKTWTKMEKKALAARPSGNANTLFVGNLNRTWRKELVLKEFEKEVEGIVNFEVTMDALNKDLNRGFGFATFKTVDACKAAHAKYHKDKLKIMDNNVMVDWAETRGNKEDDERGVYITNVDEGVEDEPFRKHFGHFGVIEKVVYGRLIGHAKRKDFAIINFTTRDAARECIKTMNGTEFMDKKLEVTMAKAKRKRDNFTSGRGGGGGGGRGGGFNAGRGAPAGGRGYAGGSYGTAYGGSGAPRPYNGGGGGRGSFAGRGTFAAGAGGRGGYGGGAYMAGGGGGGGGGRGRGNVPYGGGSSYGGGQAYHAGGGGGGGRGGGGYQSPPVTPQQAFQSQGYGYGGYGAQPVAPQPYHAGGGGGGAGTGGSGGGGGGGSQWQQQQQQQRRY